MFKAILIFAMFVISNSAVAGQVEKTVSFKTKLFCAYEHNWDPIYSYLKSEIHRQSNGTLELTLEQKEKRRRISSSFNPLGILTGDIETFSSTHDTFDAIKFGLRCLGNCQSQKNIRIDLSNVGIATGNMVGCFVFHKDICKDFDEKIFKIGAPLAKLNFYSSCSDRAIPVSYANYPDPWVNYTVNEGRVKDVNKVILSLTYLQ